MDSIRVIVGLGNPGARYDYTRHNVGVDFLMDFASTHFMQWNKGRDGISIAKGEFAGSPVILAQLNSYMNNSGQPVARLKRKFQLTSNEILILYDDMDLPLGTIRIRPRGGAGGHKGVGSIIALLGTEEFPRLRVGIGKPRIEGGEIGHVLGKFTFEEEMVLGTVRKTVLEAISDIIRNGLDKAMGKFNTNVEVQGL